MTQALDLNKRAWTKTHGPITAIGTWLRSEGQFRPCLVLIPTGGEYSDRLVPCVVTVDKAWVWSEAVGIGDPRLSARTSASFAEHMGFDITPQNCIRITTIIHDHLGDLLTIKPYQSEKGEVVGEATLVDLATGRVTETEIRADV